MIYIHIYYIESRKKQKTAKEHKDLFGGYLFLALHLHRNQKVKS